MSAIQTFNTEEADAMNDIYIMFSEDKMAYLTEDFYSSPERIIEQVNVDAYGNAKFVKRFFLNEEGVYPINLAGPAVTKVIPWNLAKNNTELKNFDNNHLGKPKTGYFINVRQLGMSRLNMVKVSDSYKPETDTPIANDSLFTPKTTFIPVPEDQHYQLQQVPADNLYIAFFQQPDKTRTDSDCYSYCVSYISMEEVYKHLVPEVASRKEQKEAIKHLETYYGKTQVQAGALNPHDIFPNYHQDQENINNPFTITLGGGEDGGGATCYVANLRTFKS